MHNIKDVTLLFNDEFIKYSVDLFGKSNMTFSDFYSGPNLVT